MAKQKKLEKDLEYVKATMAFENMDLDREEIEVCRRILKGENSADQERQKIFEKYRKE